MAWGGEVQGPEIISSAARVLSSVSPTQLVIRIQPEVASELGLREGQTIRSAVADDGKSIQLFQENTTRTFVLNLEAFRGQAFPLRLVTSEQGPTLRNNIAATIPPAGQSTPETPSAAQATESSRWVRLFSQNPQLQQTPLLHSGISLLKEFDKRGLRLDREAAQLLDAKAAQISPGLVKSALYFSGVLGRVFDRRAQARIGGRDFLSLLRELKVTSPGSREQDFSLKEVDAALDYLDSNKLQALIDNRSGQCCFRFFIPLQDLPSVAVTLKQVKADAPSGGEGPMQPPSAHAAGITMTYDELRQTGAEKPQQGVEHGLQGEMKSDQDRYASGGGDGDEQVDRNESEGESGHAARQGWSVDLDWYLAENDRVSINAVTEAKNQVSLMFWISNETTLKLAKAFQGRLISQIKGLNFAVATCEFVQGERPIASARDSLEKSSFRVDA
jgi:hypothetical protein